jgi:Bacterial regulatory helix-turn-helix protein, lysR family
MELPHICYFLTLVEERNFVRAAAKVGIAQSRFSSQIRDLEAEVGARLFDRVPHGAELTSAGQAFLVPGGGRDHAGHGREGGARRLARRSRGDTGAGSRLDIVARRRKLNAPA